MIEYCHSNATFLPIWSDGLSPCIYDTVKPIVLFLIPFCKWLYNEHRVHHCKRNRCKHNKKQEEDQVGLIQNAEPVDDMHQSIDMEDVKECKKKFFKDFSFPELPLPFLYAVQMFLHGIQFVLPLAHLLAKVILCKNCTSGVDLLSGGLEVIGWFFALKALKCERFRYYVIKAKHHSIPLILFWFLALLFEALVFVSWNSMQWYLREHKTGTDLLNFIMFCLRLSVTIMLFILGLHGPGLYKIKKEKKQVDPTHKSPFSALWEKSKQLWPFIWPRDNWLRLRVVMAVFLLVAARVVNVFVPLQNKKIVNYLTDKKNTSDPWHLILIYMLLTFLQGGGGIGASGLLGNLRSYIWIKVQQYTSRSVQTELFEHLHHLSLRWHLQRKTGEVIRMVDRGSTSIESLLSYILFQIVPTIVDILVALVFFGAVFNGWFALIVFLTMSFYIAATVIVTEWRTKFRREMNEKENITKAAAVDSLLNFETVKYYNNESFEVTRYQDKIMNYQSAQWMSLVTLNVLNISQSVIITGGLLAGMLYCGKLVVEGKLTVGDFVLFITYVRQLYTPLNFFGTYYRLIQAAFIDMENMFDLLSEKVEVIDVDEAPVIRLNHGLVEFRNVEFYYDERKPILKGISFSVLPGQTVALVGPSGSGKSTIIRLLFRFYDVHSGTVLIDGQDIRQVTQKSLRQIIGVVPQDTVLFNDTIQYNIAYGRVGSDESEVSDAAAAADIHVKITGFPEAYETVVGERGLKLSGGEKQRVAIARTLLKAPEIVLLDEATSALDTQTERNIQASLNRVCANKTTIVVAHRLSTIIGADQILVLKDGIIVERGRHHELLEKNGLYAVMWNQQQQDEATEEAASPSDKKDD